MQIVRTIAAACAVTLSACATASPGSDSAEGIAPIVGREDLAGCVWEEIGAVEEQDRASISFDDEGALRRDLGRVAARRGATVVVDYATIRVTPVSSRSAAGRGRPAVRMARGMAVRIEGGSCAAVSAG